MSIEVSGLSKLYNTQRAVDDIAFSIPMGQVVGFLGPNGAGKSTTMKMLTAFVQPSSGSAKVCGIDVQEEPMVVKGLIGYLPENNPLYLDMYVREFLTFAAQVHKLKNSKQRVEEVIELTGLQNERSKKIAQLSKGYRQRVGLAQALIHEPKVLILDEPTSGLDPNQVLEIRKLISSLGKDRTVLLSTHIMQEVEAMCQRVIIINKGKIVADDSTEAISNQLQSENVMTVRFGEEIDPEILRINSGINSVENIGDRLYKVTAKKDVDLARLLFQTAVENNNIIVEQQQVKANLESVFQQLTKNA